MSILAYQFIQNALVSCILASIVCAVIGTIIVEKKMLMLSGGIAHTAYGGVGLGYLLGFEPLIGAMGFSILASLAIAFVKHKSKAKSDVIIALFWSFGMALGVLFTALMPGYPPDLTSYLFGNILAITKSDLTMMSVLSFVVVASIIVFFTDWKTFLFDTEYAKVCGYKVNLMDYILMVLVALTVVVLLRSVGIILVIALLAAPTACASLFSKNLKNRIILATLFSLFFCIAGLFISFYFDIPSGATIVCLAVATYTILWLFKR